MLALHESREKAQSKTPILVGKKLMGKNLTENWHISKSLAVLLFSTIPGLSNCYQFFGKKQYMCLGGRTVVQADLYICTSW